MSLYLCVYILLLIISLYSFIFKKDFKIWYWICFVIILLMICFRYGQGTDYFSYNWIYNSAPKEFNFNDIFYTNLYHSEVGWKFLNNFFRSCNINFSEFIIILSIFEMICINRFIKQYCVEYKCIALLLIYPTLYLSYMFSNLRQGLVICFFLGFLLKILVDNKIFKFYIMVGVLCLVHTASLVLLAAPIILKCKLKTLYKVLGVAMIIGIMFSVGLFNPIIKMLGSIGSFGHYIKNSISFLALAERVLMFSLISYMYSIYSRKNKEIKLEPIMKLYTFGTIIYLVFFWNDLVASRLCYIYKPLEISLIIFMLFRLEKFRTILFVVIISLTTILLIKNINSYIDQGNYYPKVTVVNYPYISYFNSKDIYLYRSINFLYRIN